MNIGLKEDDMSSSIEKKESPQGKLIDIGGYKLHLNCLGKGSPTVILEAGLGSNLKAWENVQPSIAKFTQVCSYDRAGLGWSEPGLKPRTSEVIIKELRLLLENANIKGPYVLVGHSFGGYHIRLFASCFPAEVVGMVLIDTNHHDQEKHYTFTKEEAERASRNKEGVRVPQDFFECANQVRNAKPLHDIPLVVIAGKNDRPDFWLGLQKNLPNIVQNGKFILAEESGHRVQNDQPEIVIEAIHQVVNEARSYSD